MAYSNAILDKADDVKERLDMLKFDQAENIKMLFDQKMDMKAVR
jgi:hypothetical protein